VILLERSRRKRVNNKKIIIVFAIILLAILLFLYYRTLKVKNIYVVGNKLIKESEILENTNLLTYPQLYQVSESDIKNSLSDNKLINNVRVKKSLTGKITIEISENKILYQDKNSKYTLSNKEEVELDDIYIGIPTLINDCSDVRDKFIDKMLLIEDDILKHISEIEYKPTKLDKERFMFYMTDGNYVYVTLSKMNLINSYNEIYPTLEGKKGILYLDSGNHFEIKEKKDNVE
jgi:cell division septal protein FtsQ